MTTADTVVRVELRGAARDLMKAKDAEILVSGPAGTGKTQAALLKLHLLCMSKPGVRALVVRKTHVSLSASTLMTYKKKVAVEAIAMNHVTFFGGSGSEPAAFRYANGSTLVVGGLDRPTKLLSTEYDVILVDEAIETVPDDLDVLITRLRNGVLPYQQLIMLTNPGSPSHHLKVRADTGRSRLLYSRHEDNPAYYQDGAWTEAGKNYLAILDTLPTVRRQRYLLGQWVAAEGLIYDEFDPAIHIVPNFPERKPPKEWDRVIAIDWGFTNPFVAMWIAIDPDGRMHVYKEIYQTGIMVPDAAKMVAQAIKYDSAPPSRIICDHDAGDRAILEKELGMSTLAAMKDVKTGIEAVQQRLRKDATGKPRLVICKDTLTRRDPKLLEARRPTCLQEEVTTYVWDQRSQPGSASQREAPVKQDDHSCDALRYAVMYQDMRRKPGLRVFYTR
jgi:phage terminase large subunit